MSGPTRAAGYADYSSSGTIKFIPEIYSPKLVDKFYETSVFPSICQTDVEGEVAAAGDTVYFRKVPTVELADYEVGEVLEATDYKTPESTAVTFSLDKTKAFFVRTDEIDRRQSDIDALDLFADDGSINLRNDADRRLLAEIYQDVDGDNVGNSAGAESNDIELGEADDPVGLNAGNILDFIVDCGTVGDEQVWPDEDRWMVLPPAIVGLIKKSDLQDASLAGDDQSILRNGRVGMIDRFTIYRSNHVQKVTASETYWNVLFGHRSALAFGSQILHLERLANPWHFGQLMRGLHVFGYKGLEGKYFGHARVNKQAAT